MGFACFIRTFNVKKETIRETYDHCLLQALKHYGSTSLPRGTSIEIGEWKGTLQIEIYGFGQDSRCYFCKCFCEEIGENNIRRNNCPYY